jgi:hypothetical protein
MIIKHKKIDLRLKLKDYLENEQGCVSSYFNISTHKTRISVFSKTQTYENKVKSYAFVTITTRE